MSSVKNFYSLILCGGFGERLWPYSTTARPKHLIPFLNGLTLLEHTINRCSSLCGKIWIITSDQQKTKIKQLVEKKVDRIFIEPAKKNTAPAILLTCFEIVKNDPDAIVGFFPADAYIPDILTFSTYLNVAINYSENSNSICLLGLTPHKAATGYGYIEVSKVPNCRDLDILKVIKFHEKPDAAVAEQYLDDGNKLWNLGVFVGKVDSFLKEFQETSPLLYNQVYDFFHSGDLAIYKFIDDISIDYAVIEKSKNIEVLPVDFTWSDVGNLEVFLSLNPTKKTENVIEIDSTNNLIDVKDKIVALIGINDVCVVEQAGVLVIAKRSEVEKIRTIAQIFKKNSELVR